MIDFYNNSKSVLVRIVTCLVLLVVDIISLRVLVLAVEFKGFEVYAISLAVSLLVLILIVRLASQGFSNKAHIFVENHNIKNTKTLRKNVAYLGKWYSSSKLIDDTGKAIKKEDYINYILNKHYIDDNLYDDFIDNSSICYDKVCRGLL